MSTENISSVPPIPTAGKGTQEQAATDQTGADALTTGAGVAGGGVVGAAIGLSIAGPLGGAIGAAVGAFVGGFGGAALAEAPLPAPPETDLGAGDTHFLEPLRTPGAPPSHDEIAARAWSIFAREGYPPGRDLEHWLRAEAELTVQARD